MLVHCHSDRCPGQGVAGARCGRTSTAFDSEEKLRLKEEGLILFAEFKWYLCLQSRTTGTISLKGKDLLMCLGLYLEIWPRQSCLGSAGGSASSEGHTAGCLRSAGPLHRQEVL